MNRAKSILIVDDEYDIVSSLEMIFALEGHDVRTAFHGREAIAMLDKDAGAPDLILSDVMMPVLDGYGFVRELRERTRFAGVPLILMSAAQLDTSRVSATSYSQFVRKPFDLERLISLVDRLLVGMPATDGGPE